MELSYEFRRRCERIAADQRRLVERLPHEPLRGELLAAHHGIRVCEPHGMPGVTGEQADALSQQTDWDAVFLTALSPPIIVLRPDVSPARRQSTLMHEMAHYLLRHTALAFDTAQTALEPRRNLDEAEAQYLGGCLQVPQVGLIWAAQSGLSATRTAAHFGASEQLVTWRARILQIALRG